MTIIDYKPHDKTHDHHIALQNGLLDLKAYIRGDETMLQELTPLWFSETLLPYEFDPLAICPRWTNTLISNMGGDLERVSVLQEWAGYLLYPKLDRQRFLAIEGEGGNGKSVFLAGLTAMLGTQNVSNIPLESFSSRFALIGTLGKMANIASDCGELDKADEGKLKTFTTGERMDFDRKGLPSINTSPTAKLILAFNNRPRFSDRTGGLWRRMLLVPFDVVIKDDDKIWGLDDHMVWEASGECPGIFNWALEGLKRLLDQKDFTKPAACESALEDYRTEVNPAKAFLKEKCSAGAEEDFVIVRDLYTAYKEWSADSGYRSLGERQFGKEVKRIFMKVERKQNRVVGGREWRYYGLLHGTGTDSGF